MNREQLWTFIQKEWTSDVTGWQRGCDTMVVLYPIRSRASVLKPSVAANWELNNASDTHDDNFLDILSRSLKPRTLWASPSPPRAIRKSEQQSRVKVKDLTRSRAEVLHITPVCFGVFFARCISHWSAAIPPLFTHFEPTSFTPILIVTVERG